METQALTRAAPEGQVEAEHQGADGLSGATLLFLQLRLRTTSAGEAAHRLRSRQEKKRNKTRQVCQGLLTDSFQTRGRG